MMECHIFFSNDRLSCITPAKYQYTFQLLLFLNTFQDGSFSNQPRLETATSSDEPIHTDMQSSQDTSVVPNHDDNYPKPVVRQSVDQLADEARLRLSYVDRGFVLRPGGYSSSSIQRCYDPGILLHFRTLDSCT